MNKLWIVTRAINAYDQEGDYFVAAYIDKPDFHQLKKLLPKETDVTVGKLARGGGKHCGDNEWYYLTEIEQGRYYQERGLL